MINALRITIDSDKIYDNVNIYQGRELEQFPNFFEDSDFAFTAKDGTFVLPYYSVTIIQLDSITRNIKDGVKLKRLSINSDITFSNPIIIPPELYDRYDIPLIFPANDQFAFTDLQGTWISSDYQVALAQLLP
jgi:hypothetical protein